MLVFGTDTSSFWRSRTAIVVTTSPRNCGTPTGGYRSPSLAEESTMKRSVGHLIHNARYRPNVNTTIYSRAYLCL